MNSKTLWCVLVAALVAGADLMASGGAAPLIPEGESFDALVDLLHAVSWNSGVYAVAWSPAGNRLAAGLGDGAVHLWDAGSGEEVSRLHPTGFRSWKVRSVAFHPDGTRLAAAYDDGIVRVWNLEGPSAPNQYRGWTVAWSRDGRLLAMGLRSGVIEVRDAGSGNEVFSALGGHQDRVSTLAWSAEGRLASGSWDGTIRIWDARDGLLVRSLDGHELAVNGVAWSPDGNLLASASSDDTVRVWNVETGEQIRRFDGHQDSVLSVAWSIDSQTLVSGSQDTHIRFWHLDGSADISDAPLLGHQEAVHAIAFSPGGEMLASGSADGSVRVLAVTTRREVWRFQGHASQVDALAFNREGTALVAGSNGDDVLRTWSLGAGDFSGAPGNLVLEGDKTLMSVAVGARETVAAGFHDGTVEIWKQGQILASTPAHGGSVLALAFSPDGEMLASGSEDRSFILWDLETTRQLPPVQTLRDVFSALAFSPDGRSLAAGTRAGWVRLWSLENPEEPRQIPSPGLDKSPEAVLSLAFPSANDLWVLLRDRTIHRWNPGAAPATTRQSYRLPERPSSVVLSPDASRLAWVKLGERIVRVESLHVGEAYTLTHRLVSGSLKSRTWIACNARDRCWRHDDGTLLLRPEGPRGELSPVLPSSAGNPPLRLEIPLAPIKVADGETAPLILKVHNEGANRAFWVGVRQATRSPGDPLIFHPPSTLATLEPGEEAEMEGRVSVHTGYEDPRGLTSRLVLELVSAQGESRNLEPIEVVASLPSVRWNSVRLSQGRVVEVSVTNVGTRPLDRTQFIADFLEHGMKSEPETVERISPGESVTISLMIPVEIDISSGAAVRIIAETAEHPAHRWISEKENIGGSWSSYRGLLFAVLLVALMLALVQWLYGRKGQLSPEHRILSRLEKDGPLEVKLLYEDSGISYQDFSEILNSLRESELVEIRHEESKDIVALKTE